MSACVWCIYLYDLSNHGETDNSSNQKNGFSGSSRYLTLRPETLWQVTWILMAQQYYSWELLREFLDYLPKQLLPNTQGFEQHINIPVASFPFWVLEYFPSLILLSHLCSSQSYANLLIHLHQFKRERRGSGWHIFDGRYTMFPMLSSHGALCYLHPALPLRILTAGLPEKRD